jgi:hypothetical protein
MGTLKVRYPTANWSAILGSGQDAANVARWNVAWGAVGWTSYNGALALNVDSGTSQNMGQVTFTPVAGRRYRFRLVLSAIPSAGPRGPVNLGVNGVSDSAYGGPWMFSPSSPNEYTTQQLEWNLDLKPLPAGVPVTLSALITCRVAGTLYRDVAYIEDLGPVVQASIAPPTAGPRVVASGNALGIVAVGSMVGQSGASIAAATLTPVSNPTSAFLAVGRRYRISGSVRATSAASGSAYLRVTGPSWLPQHDTWVVNSGSYDQINLAFLVDGTGLTETFTLNFYGSAVTSIWTEQIVSYFWIEDVGPNSYPALPIPAIDPPFTPAVMQNAWLGNGGSWGPVGYRKIGDEVSLRGMITGGVALTTALTLPPGFRPPYQKEYVCSGWSASTGRLFTMVSISQGGAVTPENGGASFNVNFGEIKFSTTP